jgi:hypothetical protein
LNQRRKRVDGEPREAALGAVVYGATVKGTRRQRKKGKPRMMNLKEGEMMGKRMWMRWRVRREDERGKRS